MTTQMTFSHKAVRVTALMMLLGLFLSACAGSSGPSAPSALGTYTGYFKQGFEQSDFYTLDGEGPYWLNGSETVYDRLQDHLVRQDGRGSYITVKLSVIGTLERGDEYGHVGQYPFQLYATEIIEIEPISIDSYEQWVGNLIAERQAEG